MVIIPTIKLFETDAYLTQINTTVAVQKGDVICLNETVFYAESGGQPGDIGVLVLDDGRALAVKETRYIPGRLRIAHVLEQPFDGNLTNQKVTAQIDWKRRYRLMRMHSCLHLLCSLIDASVTGCSIQPNYGRLDFDIEDTIDREKISNHLKILINQNLPIEASFVSIKELQDNPSLVRTIQPPPNTGNTIRVVQIGNVNQQPCGGTHVRTTGEIGQVDIVSIEKKGRRNRRVRIAFT